MSIADLLERRESHDVTEKGLGDGRTTPAKCLYSTLLELITARNNG